MEKRLEYECMRSSEIKNKTLTPVGDLVAFEWIKPKRSSGILIPETAYDIASFPGETEGLRVGRFYLGRVLATGRKAWNIKKGDIIVVHEYGVKNYEGAWKEDHIYFIEEKFCRCKVDAPPKKGYFDLRGKISKKEIENMKGGVEGREEGFKPEISYPQVNP